MKDNIFLILFCVFFIILDTLVLGYSIGRIYPPIPTMASTQTSASNSSTRKEKQQDLPEENVESSLEEENVESSLEEENVDTTSQQQKDLLEEKQETPITEQMQNLQNEQQATVIIEETNIIEPIIEPEIPYTYTREEINAMLIIDGGLFLESDNYEGKQDTDTVTDTDTDTDTIINGETCYMGMAYTGVAWSELMPYDDRAGFFVGSQSLKVYNENKEYIGMATENFLPALAEANQSHLQ